MLKSTLCKIILKKLAYHYSVKVECIKPPGIDVSDIKPYGTVNLSTYIVASGVTGVGVNFSVPILSATHFPQILSDVKLNGKISNRKVGETVVGI